MRAHGRGKAGLLRRFLSSVSAWMLLSPAGCGGSPAEDAVVELGTGETRFVPLAEGEELALVAGPQGGHHVWVSFRAEGMTTGRVLMELDLVPLTSGEPPPRAEPIRLRMEPDEAGLVFVGWPAVLAEPACAAGQSMSLRITLTDGEGHRGSDERVIVPVGSDLGSCE